MAAELRPLLFRENYGAHVTFEIVGDSVVSLRTRINRDEFVARKATAPKN